MINDGCGWLVREIKYNLGFIEKKPKQRRRSKYDPIIDEFMTGEGKLAKVTIENVEPTYLRTQLMKRIEARELSNKISISTISGQVILEKL